MPLSLALGELNEWTTTGPLDESPDSCSWKTSWAGFSFCKIGLAGAPVDWQQRWVELATRLIADFAAPPAWVAVSYIDWRRAQAPEPARVIDVAASFGNCQGVLFDTWDKSGGEFIDLAWQPLVERVHAAGRFVAIAGSLDAARIERMAELRPDIWAVRGAACRNGQRMATIDPDRLARLVEVTQKLGNR